MASILLTKSFNFFSIYGDRFNSTLSFAKTHLYQICISTKSVWNEKEISEKLLEYVICVASCFKIFMLLKPRIIGLQVCTSMWAGIVKKLLGALSAARLWHMVRERRHATNTEYSGWIKLVFQHLSTWTLRCQATGFRFKDHFFE
jgi:hypothetical protein